MDFLPILSTFLTVVLVAVSVLIVLIVLLQRPKQEGLGSAFGGSTLDSALGAHTTDVLQKITTWLGVIFFASAIILSMVKAEQFRSSAASDVLDDVEKREPAIPGLDGLPASITDLPKADETKPSAKDKALEKTPKPKAADKKTDAPAPKKEEVPKKEEAPTVPKKSAPEKSDKPGQ